MSAKAKAAALGFVAGVVLMLLWRHGPEAVAGELWRLLWRLVGLP